MPYATSAFSRDDRIADEQPIRRRNASNRVTPENASRSTSSVHFSPTSDTAAPMEHGASIDATSSEADGTGNGSGVFIRKKDSAS